MCNRQADAGGDWSAKKLAGTPCIWPADVLGKLKTTTEHLYAGGFKPAGNAYE
jgi:hypothetical protein